MIKRAWTYGLAALTLCNVACNSGHDTAGSSFETENSLAVLVQLADGTPAARMKVVVRPESYLSGASDQDTDSLLNRQLNFETDEYGRVVLSDFASGAYVIEARSDSLKGFAKIAYNEADSSTTLKVNVSEPAKVSGRVGLPKMVRSATVAVQGFDYQVQTDSLGYFEFESLPEGDVDVVAFVHVDTTFVNDRGFSEQIKSTQIYGILSTNVGDKSEDIYVGDSAYIKTYFMLDDFENGIGQWKAAASKNATVDLNVDSTGGLENSMAAHFVCIRDSVVDWDWSLIGHELGGFVDMSDLDSITFWARASEPSKVSFAFDMFVNDDSVTSSENIKSWGHYEVDTEWTRIVVIPSELQKADSSGGNVGWDAVKNQVTKLSIFGQMGTEVWIDDVEVFGYGIFDPYAPLPKKKD
jgi:hypothetical protein